MTIPAGCFIEYREDEDTWLAYSCGKVSLRYQPDIDRVTFALVGAPLDLVEAFVKEIRSSHKRKRG